ncbi:hypothetical protein DY000_02062590 [Brassica cretica]|uniref:START domain-containing protein n=1 Tax=Brassica cretica TaxID=69181 RepID=A0ABQ7AZR6_BRACR|nr:hypothetical protein DY000_02062590 [Brassica cretica]
MTQHSDSDFDHWAGLMSTLRDSSAWSEGVYYVRRVGETDPQDVYTVFPDHTNDCDVGAKYEWEAISVALFWTLKASLSMPSGDLVKIRFLLLDVLLVLTDRSRNHPGVRSLIGIRSMSMTTRPRRSVYDTSSMAI